MLRSFRLLPLLLVLSWLVLSWLVGCATPQRGTPSNSEGATVEATGPFPAWLALPGDLARSPELEEAAALLCARDTHAVIDDDVRRATRVYDGQVGGLLERGTVDEARAALAMKAGPLVGELRATHVGFAEGALPDGRSCAALVAVRRSLQLGAELPASVAADEPFPLVVTPREAGNHRAAIYLLRPDGHVELRNRDGGRISDVVAPQGGEGRYVLEVVLTKPGEDDPEVALLWPFVVGTPKLAPAPRVLFPDEGHSDVALGYRLQALVERLRTTQLLDVLKISPELQALAKSRAETLAKEGRLGHRLPAGRSAADSLRANAPGFFFAHLTEVQAQAGTLEEAWTALLESPAHRYELVKPNATHLGAAVARGEDALGRPLVSVVALLARKKPLRPVSELSTELLGKLNLARHGRGSPALAVRPSLSRIATRLATAMAERGALDERALGAPVSALALEADPDLEDVRVVVARLDDPLRLAPPSAALEEDARAVGIGLAQGAAEWFLCLLVATRIE